MFLDALCICAAPLAVLAAVLRPAALADCGLQASRVVLLWPRPPYRAQLLVHTVRTRSLCHSLNPKPYSKS